MVAFCPCIRGRLEILHFFNSFSISVVEMWEYISSFLDHRLCSPTLCLIRDSHTIDDFADILSIKHTIALVLEADIDFLHPVVMRDGILNDSEASLRMENLIADFTVGIRVAFFDTGESLGGDLRIDRCLMPLVQISKHVEFSHVISVICGNRVSKGPLLPMESELLWQRLGSTPTILQAHFQSSPWDVSRRESPMYLSR